jgi:8-oxo-dGTP pyrophosphatase MutT (NUDIX family)
VWQQGGYGTVQSTLVMMCSDGFITVQRVRVAGNQWRTITYATPLEARRPTSLQTYRPAMFLREVPEAAETEGKLPPVAEEDELVGSESVTSAPSTAVQTTKGLRELQPGSVELCCLCLFPCTGDADGDSDMMTTCCLPSGRPSEPEAPQVTAEEKELQAATAAMVKDTRFPLVSRLMSQLLLTPPLELHYVQRNQAFGSPYTNPASTQKRAAVAVILRLAPTAPARLSTGNEGVEVLMLQTWSGNVCLPGGHVQGTETLAETAIRKTREETQLDLQRQRALLIGRLNDRKPSGSHNLVVSVFVFALPVTESDPPIKMQGDDIAGYRYGPSR